MTNATTRADMQKAELLFQLLKKPETLPISYKVDGVSCSGMPADAAEETKFLDSNIVQTVYTAEINGLRIKAEILKYRDFPAAEWTLFFTYDGEGDSPLLSALKSADMEICGEGARVISCNGDFDSPDGYVSTMHDLSCGNGFSQAPNGGRACNGAFPYQRLLFNDFGVNIAIGWPGQWSCSYEGKEHSVAFTAGQQDVNTVIRKGEVFRSPRMAMVFFLGDLDRGINMWRRFYKAHVMPKAGGEPVRNFVMSHDTGGGIEFTESTEAINLASIKDHVEHNVPVNLWWLDAGWYPSKLPDGTIDWWRTTGTWIADPERYPNGLLALKKPLEDAKMDLLVWFEPERANPGTYICDNHPEWLLRKNEPQEGVVEYGLMVDIGNPDCNKWLCETIGNFLCENNIKVYRQDFNFEPLEYWRYNEAENRIGMIENRYVQGYLKYWDYLLMNVPDLLIDSCASGGRRNDLESMKRAVPMHFTDNSYGNAPVQQSFATVMLTWIPYFRAFVRTWEMENGEYGTPGYYDPQPFEIDEFVVLHSISPVMSWGDLLDQYKDDPWKLSVMQKAAQMCHVIAPYMIYADFYLLTEYHKSRFAWTVWQFDRPEDETGVIRVVSNNGASQGSITVYPKGLEGACWLLENMYTGETMEICGDEVTKNGLTFRQDKRVISFWKYKKI